jgi:hypothetical protein
MLHQRVDGAFGCGVRRDRPDSATRRQRRKQNDGAPLRQDRKQLLHKKEGGAYVDGEQLIEILDGAFLDGCGFRDPGIGDKNIEAIADDVAGDSP